MQGDNVGEESDKTSEQRVLSAGGPPTEEAGTVDRAKPNSGRWWVLAMMGLGVFMVFLDSAVVNTALPAISRDLGASTSTLQWVVNAYLLILAGLLLVGGTAGDVPMKGVELGTPKGLRYELAKSSSMRPLTRMDPFPPPALSCNGCPRFFQGVKYA